ncbi:MAG: alanine dehydrogenase [Candidatus Spechtbacteria bacterium]|nr:alanine dehydrogenase [Candidatus Spechtbacteria bacterium]
MIVGVPKEIKENEGRVGMTPSQVGQLIKNKHSVLVERGAGVLSGFTDVEYRKAGAQIKPSAQEVYKKAELIVKVKEPLEKEYSLLQQGQTVFTYLHLAAAGKLLDTLLKKRITGIDYATVRTAEGRLPLLEPMSEITGRLAPQIGARLLEKHRGEGKGVLLSGTSNVAPGVVVIIGGGVVGRYSTMIASGMGARTILLEKNPDKVTQLKKDFEKSINVQVMVSSPATIAKYIKDADMVVGAVLVPGGKAPKVITKTMVKTMKKDSVFVDVAIDQGGCAETSHVTTHANATFRVFDVIHYGIPNIPSLVPATATRALTDRTFPYVKLLVQKGIEKAVKHDSSLAEGVNTYAGKITYKRLAEDFRKAFTPITTLIG